MKTTFVQEKYRILNQTQKGSITPFHCLSILVQFLTKWFVHQRRQEWNTPLNLGLFPSTSDDSGIEQQHAAATGSVLWGSAALRAGEVGEKRGAQDAKRPSVSTHPVWTRAAHVRWWVQLVFAICSCRGGGCEDLGSYNRCAALPPPWGLRPPDQRTRFVAEQNHRLCVPLLTLLDWVWFWDVSCFKQMQADFFLPRTWLRFPSSLCSSYKCNRWLLWKSDAAHACFSYNSLDPPLCWGIIETCTRHVRSTWILHELEKAIATYPQKQTTYLIRHVSFTLSKQRLRAANIWFQQISLVTARNESIFVGRRFAEQEMYVVIAKLLRQYRLAWDHPEPMKQRYNLLLTPDKTDHFTFTKLWFSRGQTFVQEQDWETCRTRTFVYTQSQRVPFEHWFGALCWQDCPKNTNIVNGSCGSTSNSTVFEKEGSPTLWKCLPIEVFPVSFNQVNWNERHPRTSIAASLNMTEEHTQHTPQVHGDEILVVFPVQREVQKTTKYRPNETSHFGYHLNIRNNEVRNPIARKTTEHP